MRRLVLGGILVSIAALAAQEVSLEYRVKAAYLYNFTRFVEWPAAALGGLDTFTICVAETNPFGPVLAETLAGEATAGRRLVARVVTDPAPSCQILFVPESVRAAPHLQRVRGAPVLTVGESPDFIDQGGIVRFVRDGGKIRFEISQEAAARHQLTISSRVLKLAILRVGTGEGVR